MLGKDLGKPSCGFQTVSGTSRHGGGWDRRGCGVGRARETKQKLRKKWAEHCVANTLNLVGSTLLVLAEHCVAVLAVFPEHVDAAHCPQ